MSEIQSKDSSVPLRPLRILIADDSRDDLELTIRELEKSDPDVEIDSVSTREAFVEKLRSHTVDMVLSDYRMPGRTGMDAFSEIVKSGQDIPLILVTGRLGDLKAVECIQIGMADYVLKQRWQLELTPFLRA
jgi:two-component system sensor histidine kinase UhpB